MTRPWAIAHRGASGFRPENTRAAFDAAIEAGCDGIELDVQLSRDGVPMVYHDRTLRRLGLPRVRVCDLEARELRRLDAGSWFHRRFRGERLLTLREVVRRYATRTTLLVEIKVRRADRRDAHHLALAEAVAEVLRSARVQRRVFVLSYDGGALDRIARRDPRLRTVLNLRPPRRMNRALLGKIVPLSAVSVDRRGLTAGFVRSCQQRGKPVLVFTCNTDAAMRETLACGADAVMSDHPDRLRRVVDAQAPPR